MDRGRRRRQILDAARTVFAARGFHATSVAQIIEAAGIARGTFYLYFAGKRAIFDELVDQFLVAVWSSVRPVVVDADHPPAHEQLRTNVSRTLALLREEGEMAVILLNHATGLDRESDEKLRAFYDQMCGALVHALERGREMGPVTTDDPEVAARLILGSIKEVTRLVVIEDDDRDHDRLVDEILRFGLGGVTGSCRPPWPVEESTSGTGRMEGRRG